MTIFEPTEPVAFSEWQASLPPEYPDSTLLERIRERNRGGAKVVVLDDDPTGPQAISDVYVLTDWSVDALQRELAEPRPLFFILANTRAMPEDRAVALHREIAGNLRVAAEAVGCRYALVSRSDSTLRGHYPAEVDALGDCDGTIIAPFFLEGGRYTYGDVQWVREGDHLLPAAVTPYARDLAFGYQHSNMRNWVEEKWDGRMRADDVQSISLELIRRGGPDAVAASLLSSRRQTTIVNAASYRDMEVFVAGLMSAEAAGWRFVCRTAASFVRVRAGQGNPPIAAGLSKRPGGGLVIVGSHVPKSSAQLNVLMRALPVDSIELSVPEIAQGRAARETERAGALIAHSIRQGRTAVLYTTRTVETRSATDSLELGANITQTVVNIVRSLSSEPAYLIVKGGWTASVIGTQALGAKRAYAPAPILPGVPMWLLGDETRFPGMPYVIFPGNVGSDDALLTVVQRLQTA
ncbi:MAG: hypothetical protein HZB53_17225 [Chloroflexi bacterium]|nr:hypothetical protein [Chloroflexota bacterium]